VKPYYSDDLVTIYHGDCREILPTLDSVDLVLMDPPYGNGTEYGTYQDSPEALEATLATLMPVALAIAPVVLVTPGVANIHRYPAPRWTLAWVEPAGSGSGPWGFASWQPVLAYGTDPYLSRGLGRRPDTYIRRGLMQTPDWVNHPCPKPEDVWRWLVVRGTAVDGSTVLDPFMGSGTTLAAAKATNRHAIGIEIEERYCEIAANRCRQEVLGLTA
jgi:site-specific DNA-methyltransferase (adenine-specific)